MAVDFFPPFATSMRPVDSTSSAMGTGEPRIRVFSGHRRDCYVVRTMRCPCCRAPIAISDAHRSGLCIEYGPGGLVIYNCSSPIHSCDLERAQQTEREAS